jgi:enoyl-CoA hydratase/carnithine racemase
LKRIIGEIADGASIRGVVMYGRGRHFSSGAVLDDLIGSLKNDNAGREAGESLLSENLSSFSFFEELAVPVIAAIRGVCLGSGLELALFCHARICGAGSVLGLPETGFGLIPGCGGILNLAARAGRRRALESVLTGSSFGADEARAMDMVDAVVPRKDVVASAVRFIEKIDEHGGYDRARIRGYINRFL